MPKTIPIEVSQLALDLENFRTVRQTTERKAIHALVAVDTDWFWELMRSLIGDGYLPTENIVVLQKHGKFIVKEGNRRIAALKLILGKVRRSDYDLPDDIGTAVARLDQTWKDQNKTVPCALYSEQEAEVVDKTVALTHGKSEKAGRAVWKSVARARHARDAGKSSEPGLDLLEHYLSVAKNAPGTALERWAGDYPLSVLDEALQKIAPRIGYASSKKLADAYPSIPKYRSAIDDLLRDIGLCELVFKNVRATSPDFAIKYGFPSLAPPPVAPSTSTSKVKGAAQQSLASSPTHSTSSGKAAPPAKAMPVNTTEAVKKSLKTFKPRGSGRDKVVTLLEEARGLNLAKQPHAFCFLLRSMFEISAKAYCGDHKGKPKAPVATKATGEDRHLVDVLRDVANHLGANDPKNPMRRKLYGAITDLATPTGILSVTSMNQLVHNPQFSISETHIASVFHNIFPLLEAMNS
jgi:hypothetical protein